MVSKSDVLIPGRPPQRAWGRLHNFIQRQIHHVIALIHVHHHFGGFTHNLLNGIYVQALACYFRSFGVFRQQQFEPLSLTFRFGNYLEL